MTKGSTRNPDAADAEPARAASIHRGAGPATLPAGLTRRSVLAAGAIASMGALGGCSTPLPLLAPPPTRDHNAERLLRESAEAHGLSAYRQLRDINVAYDGEWQPGIDRIQPVVVDKAFRGRSEERLMPAIGVVAQAYTGVAGTKQVAWQRGATATGATATGATTATDTGKTRDRTGDTSKTGDIAVWVNGRASEDPRALAAAALVAEAYGLFLLGPLWLVDRGLVAQREGEQRVDGRRCHVVQVWSRPGLGRVALDRLALFVDAESGLMRRVRFTLEGTADTRGAVAEVDVLEHRALHGIQWPMRSFERVVHPLRLPAHEWHITGLDVNRGYERSTLLGPAFRGAAAAPARPLGVV